MTLGRLREHIQRLLEFGVDDTMRTQAGFYMDGGNAGNTAGNPVEPPPGLGSDDEDEVEGDTDGESQEKSQWAVRVLDRAGGPGRPLSAQRRR